MARIDNLTNFLTDVATAIKGKTGKNDAITPANFDTEIASIQSGEGKYTPKHISFYEYTGTELNDEINNLDTSNITNMKNMFYGCKKLTSLDLSNFDTSNVTSMTAMFYGCSNLENLNVSHFNTNNVEGMKSMFYNCSKLTSLDLSSFNTSNVTSLAGLSLMFYNCSSLTSLDLSNFDTSNIRSTSSMFYGCTNLNTLIINNPKIFYATNSDFLQNTPIENGTGYVYVPDELVDSYKSATNWSTYADQIKPISELEGN